MQNSRWPPGGHIGRWIATKIDRAPPLLIQTITPLKNMKLIDQVLLKLWGGMENPRNRIMTKIDRAPLLTHPAMPKKYEINQATRS
jgi:hypothetical protein